MKLYHLQRTLENHIRFYEAIGRTTKVNQLKEKLELVSNNHLENDRKTNGLYLGHSK